MKLVLKHNRYFVESSHPVSKYSEVFENETSPPAVQLIKALISMSLHCPNDDDVYKSIILDLDWNTILSQELWKSLNVFTILSNLGSPKTYAIVPLSFKAEEKDVEAHLSPPPLE